MHSKLKEAVGGLISSHHYFALQVLRAEFAEDPACETAWFDGVTMGYNPRFIDACDLDELKFLIVHEIPGHGGFLHHVRRGDKDHQLYNEAGDYVINLWLQKAGFKLIDGVLVDGRFEDMSVEQVYEILLDERQKQDKQDQQQDSPDPSEADNDSENTSGESEQTNEGGEEYGQRDDGKGSDGNGEQSNSDPPANNEDGQSGGGSEEAEEGESGSGEGSDTDAGEGGEAGEGDGETSSGMGSPGEPGGQGGRPGNTDNGPTEGGSSPGGEPKQPPDTSQVNGDGQGDGEDAGQYEKPHPSKWGEVRDFQGKDPETGEAREATEQEMDQEAERWKQIQRQAYQISSSSEGKEPGFARSLMDAHANPRLPWREVLARWFVDKMASDYNFMRPNPRYSHSGFFLPSLEATAMGHFVIIFDESGSMGTRDQKILVSETKNILQQFGDFKVTIMCVNTQVNHIEEFESLQDLPEGGFPFEGGGTCFRPGYQWIEENMDYDPPVGVIYMTDGECSTFPGEPDFETLWLITRFPRYKQFEPPFGEVAYYDEY